VEKPYLYRFLLALVTDFCSQATVQQAMKSFGGCGILSHPKIFLSHPQAKIKLPCGNVENPLFIQITMAR
jgi:hypothetical protein